jgi:hypothetical protein
MNENEKFFLMKNFLFFKKTLPPNRWTFCGKSRSPLWICTGIRAKPTFSCTATIRTNRGAKGTIIIGEGEIIY